MENHADFQYKFFPDCCLPIFTRMYKVLRVFSRFISSQQIDFSRTENSFLPKIYRDFQPKTEKETLMVLLERLNQITIPNVKLQGIGTRKQQ